MSDEKKRLADALAALASGQHEEPEHSETTKPAAEPQPPIEMEANEGAPTQATGLRSDSSQPEPRSLKADVPPVARMRAKARPLAPSSSAPRPNEPVAPAAGRAVRHETPTRPSMPVAGASSAAASATRRSSTKSKPVFASLAFRRTIIPVCLVLGIGMPLMAGLWLTLDEDHPARKISILLPMLLVVVGLGVLVLGVMTMLQVRNELSNRDQQRTV